MKTKPWAGWIVALALAGCAAAPSPAGLPMGPHRVGFAVDRAGREAANAATAAPDPFQIGIWYPASRGGQPLRYGDLLDLAGLESAPPKEQEQTRIAAARSAFATFMTRAGIDSAAVTRWRALPMAARRGAPAAGGKWPLVILVQGNGQTVADQALLAEYLASCGFVVAASPSETRRHGAPATVDSIAASAERQADDLVRILARMRTRPEVDAAHVGLVGHSFGARGALLFQMRTGAAAALVSLDGGIGTATGAESMRRAPSFAPERCTIPVLHCFETLDAPMTPDWELLRSLPGPVTVGHTSGMHHHHFTDLGGFAAVLPEVAAATGATPETPAAYRAVAQATRAFLAAALQPDATRDAGAKSTAAADSLLELSPLATGPR